jgi:hypothetical protein
MGALRIATVEARALHLVESALGAEQGPPEWPHRYVGENNYFRWRFREICDKRAAAYLQPDIGRCGGITEFGKIAALSDSYGRALTSHLWHELSISLVGAGPSSTRS